MKKLLMISAVMIATLFQVNAQKERGRDISPENLADRMTERMSERLGLNELQQKEIHALHLEQAQKRKNEMEERKEAMEARRDAMKAERDAHEAKINQILTPEQQEKWEAMRQENRQRINEGRRSPEKRMMNRGARGGNRPG
ncbi:DUF4890 domain-containing protein [Cyclobacterium sp.]|uniref:DUF4890 domain-containing protein n=1 Tax=Cyclobacterium sp. TaxID=1966343 RepID=UPI0019BCEB3C|nr:DUF4890 domain-containing protein [Cyclobacterium sp.]MBD3629580.1 DUF4890 domain-containing protein [Cyclobacterium sp.]